MNLTSFLQYAGYVGVALLAVLGNHFLGLPDAQTTNLLIGGALTALGYTRVAATSAAAKAQSALAPTAMPAPLDLQRGVDTRVGRQETP